jgi:hypothetical protein
MVGMEWLILAASIVAAVVIIVVAYKLFKLTVKLAVTLLLNALGGLFILFIINLVLNMGIPYDLPTLLICAITGVPGAICIGILALFGVFL